MCASSVTQWCPTLCDPVDCSLPGSSVHGILQARILEWVAISSSRGCHFFLLPGDAISSSFLTQGLNSSLLHLLHCRWILNYWATWEVHSPWYITTKYIKSTKFFKLLPCARHSSKRPFSSPLQPCEVVIIIASCSRRGSFNSGRLKNCPRTPEPEAAVAAA